MANKIIRKENDQFDHSDYVVFRENVSLGFTGTITDEILSADSPLTLNINGTDGISIPKGTDSQRPDGSTIGEPIIRFNTTGSEFEFYNPDTDNWETFSSISGGDYSGSLSGEIESLSGDVISLSGDVFSLSGNILYSIEREVSGGYIGADKSGNTRGNNSLDIQSARLSSSQIASGVGSIAMGSRNTSSGFYSISLGNLNTNSGAYGMGIGISNTSNFDYSMTIGYNNSSTSKNAFAIGSNNTSSGHYSSAIGYQVKTTIDSTCEIGYWISTSSRSGSVRIHSNGQVSQTLPNSDTAFTASAGANGTEVDGTLAQGMFSTRIGTTNNELVHEVNDSGIIRKYTPLKIESTGAIIGGSFSGNTRGDHSIDIQSNRTSNTDIASGSNSIAIGRDNLASGANSMSIGYTNDAISINAVAIGYGNIANSVQGALAIGILNQSNADYSSAFGHRNTASADSSSAFGYQNTASGYYSSAFGYYNKSLEHKSSAFGCRNTASGNYSSAFGHQNTASGDYSSAFGHRNTASAESSSAFGYKNTASGKYSSAFGYQVRITTDNTVEIGFWLGAIRHNGVRITKDRLCLTVKKSDTPPTDGGAIAGSEPTSSIIRNGMNFQISSSNHLIVYYNTSTGSVLSGDLGALA